MAHPHPHPHPHLSNPNPSPSTPPLGPIVTPTLSTSSTPPPPDTPYITLQTPETSRAPGRLGDDAVVKLDSVSLSVDHHHPLRSIRVGLGYGDVGDSDAKGKMRAFADDAVDSLNSDVIYSAMIARDAAGPSSVKSTPRSIRTVDEPELDDSISVLSDEEIERMRARVAELEKEIAQGSVGLAPRDELITMVRTLISVYVDQVPFLEQQIATQQATIAAMQQQQKLSKHLVDIERQRFIADRASWQAEIRALIRVRDAEILAGNRPKKTLDLDVGYHQELEAANKRLEMDNRLMAPRLADTQRQIESLVTELRHLRPHVMLGTSVFDENRAPPASPWNPSPLPKRLMPSMASPKSGGRTTMGDARAEHLLLAAKKVRSMRASNSNVGHLTLDELRRQGVVGPEGGVGYSEGYGGVHEEEDELLSTDDEEDSKNMIFQDRRVSSTGKGKSKSSPAFHGTPLLPRPKKMKRRPPTTPSRPRVIQVPQTTPGGNFSDLLLAAEMATRPGTPTRSGPNSGVLSGTLSAARSTTRDRQESASPSRKIRRAPATVEWSSRPRLTDEADRTPTRAVFSSVAATPVDDSHEASALDLLAQASQDVAQGASQGSTTGVLASAARFEGMMEDGVKPIGSPRSSGSESALGPAIDLNSGGSKPRRPSIVADEDPELTAIGDVANTPGGPLPFVQTPVRGIPSASASAFLFGDDPFMSDPTSEASIAAFQSPTGGTVPGIGKYVHLSSTMPARRVRSPYLKWTKEEDELLARAVALHGEKWDLVSKGVPTRSYHQVRQRWLRKTGAFDKKPTHHGDDSLEPSPLGRGMLEGEQLSPTPKSKKRKAS